MKPLTNTIILDYLKENLSCERYTHSINVSKEADLLAKHYGCDARKAALAGLIHDCAKDLSIKKQIEYARKCSIAVDNLTYEIPELIHAPASTYVCENKFKIKDIEVLSSVRYHTTGKTNMSLIEKIVFISDIIEPNRDFNGRQFLKKMAYKNIDKALFFALESSILFIINKKEKLHVDTVCARNFIMDTIILE